MKTYRFFLLAALVGGVLQAAPAPATAPTPTQFDLNGAIRYALDHNFDIRQARERIKQQEGVVLEVRSAEIPNVTASGSVQLNDRDISTTVPQSDSTWGLTIRATQLIVGGGVRPAVRSAELVKEAAILELQAQINFSLFDVRTRFYDVLLNREKIKVQEQNIDLLKQQLRETTDRFNAGTVSAFEKLRSEVALANGQVPLITARNDYRIALEQLRQAVGLVSTPGVEAPLDVVGTLEFSPTDFDLDAALGAARAHRPELARLERLVKANEEAVSSHRAGYYPNLSLFGGYQLGKGGTNRFEDSRNGFLVGLQSQWNIFDGRATAGRVAQAASLLEQSKLALGQQTLAIEVQVRQAVSGLQEANELSQATQKTVAQAEESLRLANARYQAGSATQLDVLTAQVDLTQARTNLLQAYYNYNTAFANFRTATGQADPVIAAP
ncbi:TolC family protein [Horticoccus luteus]|uniref:TolC family protein n=1 Tax=Horticoccus luteus TaxID=2862869 RepID=A0A8F9TW71_9BACT|nr:TolC family protein [Horticoccus luteus]QYM80221.1 TolC family protein [Horticoccus luteus]